MKIVDDNLVWMYEPSTTGINKDVETIITGDTDSDYVKVVRCKDCKHSKYREDYDDYECEASGCGLVNNADFYCADGERSETE